MSTVINTNMFSIYAQRQADTAQRAEQSAMDRLSTGVRINSAKDDTVGWAVLHHQDAQVNAYAQSIRNTNDGVSLLQVADGAMGGVTDILHRMRELTLQSVSGTLSGVDRGYLQTEFESLQDEALNIIEMTEFNNIAVLNRPADQERESLEFQIGGEFSSLVDRESFEGLAVDPKTKGYYAGSTVEIDAGIADQITLSSVSIPGVGTFNPNLTVEVDGASTGIITLDTTPRTTEQWAAELESKINANLAGESVTVSYDEGNSRLILLSDSEGGASTVKITSAVYVGGLGLSPSPVSESGQREVISMEGVPLEDRSMTIDVDNQPAVSVDLPGVTLPLGEWESLLKSKVNGMNVAYDMANQTFTLSSVNGADGSINLMGSASLLGFRMHDTNQVMVDHLDLDDPTHALGLLLQNTQSIATEADASAMLAKIDGAMDHVNEGRSHFAAVENQLLKVSQNLEEYRVAGSKARSAIQDTDYAAESAAMAKNQILKQVTTAMMAQANQVPKQMLQLFK